MRATLAIFLLIFSLTIEAQDSWDSQSSGTTSTFNDIYFVNSSTGFAAGVSGTLKTTSDGGSNWNTVSVSTSDNLNRILFTSSTTGFIVTSGGSLLSTSNGGSAWTNQILGSDGLNSITFNGNKSIVVGDNGKTYSSTDNGDNWTYNGTLGVFTLNDVFYYNDTLAIAVGGNGSIFRSVNNGTNWTLVASGTTETLSSIDNNNNNSLLIVGTNGKIINYNPISGNLTTESSGTTKWLKDVHCNSSNCYIVGVSKVILIQNGSSWLDRSNDDNINMNAVHFVDIGTGYVAGIGGVIYKTTNGGFPNSIEDLNKNSTIIYPLPAQSAIHIKSDQDFNSYQIFDGNGSIVLANSIQDKEINVEALFPGWYILRLLNDDKIITFKFTKE